MNNPRFPHRCRIYKITGVSAFTDGTEEDVYLGQCRKYSGYRATDPDGVAKELFSLSLPIIYGAEGAYSISDYGDASQIEVVSGYPEEGDVVEIETHVGNYEGRITQIMTGNFGTTIHWEDVKR